MFPSCNHCGHVSPISKNRMCRLGGKRKYVTQETCASCPHAEFITTIIEPITTPPLDPMSGCEHKGDILRIEQCQLCGSKGKRVEIRECAIHGECSGRRFKAGQNTAVCLACPDQSSPRKNEIDPIFGPANLVWYIWPRDDAKEIWSEQFAMIESAIHKFDGKKICIVSRDGSTADSDDDVIKNAKNIFSDVIQVDNSPQKREAGGWRIGMESVWRDPGFTVWLHAKGVFRGTPEKHLKRWWEIGYDVILDVDAVRKSLDTHIISGVFRRNQPAMNLGIPWHYAGAFYAVRNEEIRFPDSVSGGWYAEAWPALISPYELADCLRYDGCGDLYQAKNWREVAEK